MYARAIYIIRQLVKNSKFLEINRFALMLLSVTLVIQICAVYSPLIATLRLLQPENCGEKVRILKRLPKIYLLFVLAGAIDQFAVLYICHYIIKLEKLRQE